MHAFVWEQITNCTHFPWLWWNRTCPLCTLLILCSIALTWLSCLHGERKAPLCVRAHRQRQSYIASLMLPCSMYDMQFCISFWDLCICLELSLIACFFIFRTTGCKPVRRGYTMMPIGTPRVPYRNITEGTWQWVDLWNALVSQIVTSLRINKN